jgi:hypothetical protein
MHLRDQRARRVDHLQTASSRSVLDRSRYAMRTENRHRAIRHLIELFDEARSLRFQTLNHVPIVHDLMPYIDRRAILLESTLYNLDRAFNARAKPTRLSQDYLHDKSI